MQNENKDVEIKQETISVESPKKISWYLSIPFIVLVGFLAGGCLFGIPGIVLCIIRFIKYPQNRKSTIITAILCILIPIIVAIVAMSSSVMSIIKTEMEIEESLNNGNYENAYAILETQDAHKYGSHYSYWVRYYEEQKLYDELADYMIEYCEHNNYSEISESKLEEMETLLSLVSEEKQIVLGSKIDEIKEVQASEALSAEAESIRESMEEEARIEEETQIAETEPETAGAEETEMLEAESETADKEDAGQNSENMILEENSVEVSEEIVSQEEEQPQVQIIPQEEDNRFTVGETIYFTSGLDVSILDVGICTDDNNDSYVYVEVDIYNNTGDIVQIYPADMTFYGDGYKLDTGIPFYGNGVKCFKGDVLADGRRMTGTFYGVIDNPNFYSVIESDIGDVTVLIKDDTLTVQNTLESGYGTYSKDMDDKICYAEVGIYSDTEEAYISIRLEFDDGYVLTRYEGVLVPQADGTYKVSDLYGTELSVKVADDYLYVQVISAAESNINLMQGIYLPESETNWSEVG